jgi:hypothetical protein
MSTFGGGDELTIIVPIFFFQLQYYFIIIIIIIYNLNLLISLNIISFNSFHIYEQSNEKYL